MRCCARRCCWRASRFRRATRRARRRCCRRCWRRTRNHDRARALLATFDSAARRGGGAGRAPPTPPPVAARDSAGGRRAARAATPPSGAAASGGAQKPATKPEEGNDYGKLIAQGDRLSENGHAKEARKLYDQRARAQARRPRGDHGPRLLRSRRREVLVGGRSLQARARHVAELRRRDHRPGRGVQAARRSPRGAQLVSRSTSSRSRAGPRRRWPRTTFAISSRRWCRRPRRRQADEPPARADERRQRRRAEEERRARRRPTTTSRCSCRVRRPATSPRRNPKERRDEWLQEAVTRGRGVLRQGRGDPPARPGDRARAQDEAGGARARSRSSTSCTAPRTASS